MGPERRLKLLGKLLWRRFAMLSKSFTSRGRSEIGLVA
jgi:hypothetical protein